MNQETFTDIEYNYREKKTKREEVKNDAHLSTIDYRINRGTACRGLGKNENRLCAMFACANLYMPALAGRKLSAT